MSHSQHCECKLDLALQDGYSKESSLEVEHLSSRTCDARFSDKSNGTCVGRSEITLPSNLFLLKEEGNILDHHICGKAGAGNKVENPAGNRTADSGKALNKSATFPCSESLDSSKASILSTETHRKIADGPACSRSKSLPGSLKLVSAMKGGREVVGSPKTKLNVTWAADVVDPPATSTSHTVRSYFQGHSRSRKKEKKHKHYKGKSSQGNNSKKQHSSKRVAVSSLENPPARMSLIASGKLSEEVNITSFVDVDSMGDVAGYGSSGQDSKCRSNYLNQSLGNMHLSFTEAT